MLLLFVFKLLALNSIAGEIGLAWDANSEDDLKGYRLYWGSESGNYNNMKDVGNVTNYKITDIPNGVKHFFVVTAYNNDNKESSFSYEINHVVGQQLDPLPQKACCFKHEFDCEQLQEIIVDNKDDQTISSGDWRESSGPNPYKESSYWTITPGAEFAFLADVIGSVDVHVWWTVQTTFNVERCSDASVDIYDGAVLIDTVEIDQTKNGGQWNLAGNYDFTGNAKIVIKSEKDTCSTSADAVKFERK